MTLATYQTPAPRAILDWLTATTTVDASHLPTDRIYRVDREGIIRSEFAMRREIEGSFFSPVTLRPVRPSEYFGGTSTTCLEVSGNVGKWFTGQNVAGYPVENSDELLGLFLSRLNLHAELGLKIQDLTVANYSRQDLTRHFDLGSHEKVHETLRWWSHSSRSRHGAAIASGDTVYFGKHSRRWCFRGYCKYCELQKRPQPIDIDCRSHLRLELVLRGMELQGLPAGRAVSETFWNYFRKLTFSGGSMDGCTVPGEEKLTVRQLAILDSWLRRGDIRYRMTTPTFYRYRRIILDATGFDISTAPPLPSEPDRPRDVEQYLREREVDMAQMVLPLEGDNRRTRVRPSYARAIVPRPKKKKNAKR